MNRRTFLGMFLAAAGLRVRRVYQFGGGRYLGYREELTFLSK